MKTLENVKVGDSVILHGAQRSEVARVVRTTKTQVQVGGRKFRKSDGRVVGGDGWSSTRIEPYTEEKANEIARTQNRNNMRRYIVNYDWKYLSDEKLEQIYNILQEDKL